ncbi:aspartate-semialdehyde dehydrogenase [Phosphitispora sp. TUW77]|uniref:aspartate-semialdehyde dehydrogenase n=1 Tax=Phosphitispora sp. TUW77 TaxID=3152361 RepID=UPI003AB35404
MKKINVAIVGATGAVGQELLKILQERNFPVGGLKLLATERSAGTKINWEGRDYTVEVTGNQAFEGIDIALFAGGSASKEYAREAAKRGAVVVDNSSAFRMEPDVPLVVPEVNPEDVKRHKGIIANPNCSTIIMVVPLKVIHDAAKVKRVVVSTYQAVSGAGKEAIEELAAQVNMFAEGRKDITPEIFPYQIAFNLIPHIDVFSELDYTKEEWKMVKETKKIMHEESIEITATTVRVPVFRSHSESINIETEHRITPAEAKELLSKAPGIIVQDNPEKREYPMPLHTSNRDEVFVGRIRQDNSIANGLNMWVVSDQLRKGAATNAVQIAELVVKYGCF